MGSSVAPTSWMLWWKNGAKCQAASQPPIEANTSDPFWMFLRQSWKMIPSGKHTKNSGKSPCLMGKLTITMERSTMFNGKTQLFRLGHGFISYVTNDIPEVGRVKRPHFLTKKLHRSGRCSNSRPQGAAMGRATFSWGFGHNLWRFHWGFFLVLDGAWGKNIWPDYWPKLIKIVSWCLGKNIWPDYWPKFSDSQIVLLVKSELKILIPWPTFCWIFLGVIFKKYLALHPIVWAA